MPEGGGTPNICPSGKEYIQKGQRPSKVKNCRTVVLVESHIRELECVTELRKFWKNQGGYLKLKKSLFVKENCYRKVNAFGKGAINLLALRSYLAGLSNYEFFFINLVGKKPLFKI